MHVTVEDGRATAVAGDPDHPVTRGFLCGKVSNYLDRVYAGERLLHPLIREDGGFRRASWDEALDVTAAALRRAIDEHGGESILPYSYAGTQGLVQGNLMSQRVMNALGASELVRTICASAGIAGVTATSLRRWTPRSGHMRATCSCGAGTRCPPRRTCGGCFSTRAARGRRSWSSTRGAAAPRAWPTSTCGRSLGPTPRSRSG
jgi:hypothetical protein